MHFTVEELGSLIGSFLWPFIRISSFVMVLPLFTMHGVPARVRIALASSLALIIVPTLPAAPAMDPISAEGLVTLVQQFLIGFTLAFILRLVFAAVINAGQLTALGMGLGFASMVDPTNGIQVPVIALFYNILATLIFFSLNGHVVAIEVLAESFRVLPVGGHGIPVGRLMDIVLWGSWMFSGAFMLALPAVAAIVIVNLAFGVVTRAAPQLNIFAVGFPITITLGFVVMYVTLGSFGAGFVQLTEQGLQLMRTVMIPTNPVP
jgi:flagellar biosynthetic protein FliR